MSLNQELIARLRAIMAGRAQLWATHCKLAIQPHAQVFSAVAMAGEDTTIHACMMGRIGRPPIYYCVPDARRRDDQHRLFHLLGTRLESYLQECRQQQTFPQLIVPSQAAVGLLDRVSERLRGGRHVDDRLKRVGNYLAYFTERYLNPGQQALHAATLAMRQHWVTGQESGEDEHLLTVLTWIEPPADKVIFEAVAEAELIPMGVNTTPDFDKSVLAPLVGAYNRAVKARAHARVLDNLAQPIRRELRPIVLSMYDATQQAITLLTRLQSPGLLSLEQFEQRERREFEDYMAWLDRGIVVPLGDTPKRAAFVYNAREDATENYQAAMVLEDRIARAQAIQDGQAVIGRVENAQKQRIAPWQFVHRFQLRSRQRILRVRQNDEFYWADDTRLIVVVEDVRRQAGTTVVSFRIVEGQKGVGLPQEGAEMTLVERGPDWSRLDRLRGHLKKKLAHVPWTHDNGVIPQRSSRNAPTDPLARVEELR